MKDLKGMIVTLMEANPQSGYYLAEIADAVGVAATTVRELIVRDDDFFYDGNNPIYIGWRLSKHRQ